MNDIPPQDPTSQPPAAGIPPQAAATPPGQPPEDEMAKKLKRMKIICVVMSLVLFAVGYGVGRTVEKSRYDVGEPAYQEIYNEGAKSGAASGAEAGKEQGLEEGTAEGAEKGKKEGLKQGAEAGYKEGTQAGANAALGGLTGWSTDTPYAVEFDEGPSNDVPYAISNRVLMEPGTYYKICNSGEGICVAQPDNGGGPTGPTP